MTPEERDTARGEVDAWDVADLRRRVLAPDAEHPTVLDLTARRVAVEVQRLHDERAEREALRCWRCRATYLFCEDCREPFCAECEPGCPDGPTLCWACAPTHCRDCRTERTEARGW